MQAHWLKHASRVLVHCDERAGRRIHIPRAEVIQPRKAIELPAAVEIAVLGFAGGISDVAECVERVGIGYRTALVRQHSHGIKAIIEIVRLNAVSLLRNKLIATGV